MKKTTLVDYFRDYNEETVLQAIAYYNRNHDFESENRHRFDWDLFENILDNIEDGCLIVTEEDMEAIEDGYEDDCEDEWEGEDPYPDYDEDNYEDEDYDEDGYDDDDAPSFIKCPNMDCRTCRRCYED